MNKFPSHLNIRIAKQMLINKSSYGYTTIFQPMLGTLFHQSPIVFIWSANLYHRVSFFIYFTLTIFIQGSSDDAFHFGSYSRRILTRDFLSNTIFVCYFVPLKTNLLFISIFFLNLLNTKFPILFTFLFIFFSGWHIIIHSAQLIIATFGIKIENNPS